MARSRATTLLVAGLVFMAPWSAHAADSLILGKRLIVKDPTGDEGNRTLILLGKERPTDNSFNNTPHPVTASLRVILNCDSPSDVTYTLGAPGVWEHSGPGISGILKYTGGDPVKLLFLKFNPAANPSFILKAKLKGSAGPQSLDSLPPNLGTSGGIIFTMDQGFGEERFCVAFGGAAGGTTAVNDFRMWKVSNAAVPGCPTPEGPPESVSENAGADDTVTTDDESDGATNLDPLETFVTTPGSGTVSISEATATDPNPSGYDLVGQHADVTAPSALATDPLVLTFLVDTTVIPAGQDPATLQVFRDGVAVQACLGQPGVAFPDPCVAQRGVLGDDVLITVLSTHASRWTFGLPLCGNGVVDAGETCEPVGQQAQCNPGETCKSNCQCAVTCDCCALNAATFELTTGVGVGNCGTATDLNGGLFANLACNGIYFGGGGNAFPLPALLPDQVKLALAISSCDSATERLTLEAAPSSLTGSTRTCSTAGCSFGAPVAIPNAASTPTSSCVMLTVAQDASGTSSCDGDATVSLPLSAEIFLTGDSEHDPGGTITGIQSCPLCSGGTCVGGANNGMACVPANSTINAGYPTSQDCPPDAMNSIGAIPLGATFTSGTARAEGVATGLAGSKQRVFCGYCRDKDDTGGFQSPGQPCDADADCAQPFESCEQRNQGAFGPNGGAVKTISLTGAPAGCLADGGLHASTLVGGTCIEPTFNFTVDLAADLPGPGALSLQGSAQLAPPPPACNCGAPAPTTLTYTNAIGAGNCGISRLSTGATWLNLACGGIYTGGGGQSLPLPQTTLDGTSVTNVALCSGTSLTLAAASAAETGSPRTCTEAGCLFGPPLPVPNPTSTPTSLCVLNSLAQDAAGTADCATGATSLDFTLSQAMYLTGDTLGDAGIQPCPLCQGGTCFGGPNNGMSCTAGVDLGAAYPTSHDCPPDPMAFIGSMELPFTLGAGAVTWTGTAATNDTGTVGNQPQVFCGFCRDDDDTGGFESPAKLCWQNGMAVGSPCAQPNETCEQRTSGAFGPNGNAVMTITETGSAAGSLADHAPHATTLTSVFCIEPTFDFTIDAANDLPGPGAVSLQGTVQVQ